ncbi:MAG: hypothetical protein H6719_35265 [Sandaracinaceae bacterium]|nr:hypothetical protein [Sandaracinaceae bacterium]
MKRSGECPKCHTRPVIRLERVLDWTKHSGTAYGGPDTRAPSPRSEVERTLAVRLERSGALGGVTVRHPALTTEAYVCPGCGFFEEHVRDAKGIDWDAIEGATRHDGTRGGGPFR